MCFVYGSGFVRKKSCFCEETAKKARRKHGKKWISLFINSYP